LEKLKKTEKSSVRIGGASAGTQNEHLPNIKSRVLPLFQAIGFEFINLYCLGEELETETSVTTNLILHALK
jgi:hypothetical protein